MRETMAGWDAVETAAKLRSKDVSVREVVDAAIARAEAARHLDAIVTETFDRAREVTSLGDGAFAGVPTFIKDLAQVRGVTTTWGSRASGPYVSKKTDPIVTRFEELGLVSLGKSATPELGLTATTEPLGRPPCKNPWDPKRSTGGSSGGAAALVAAGVVPIAHASDGGGSIRIPASCCGLVGLKPSRFRLDMDGSNLLPINIACDGVVTRTVRDTAAFYEALESQRRPKGVEAIGEGSSVGPKRLRIGLFVEAPTRTPVQADNRDAALAAGRICESLGHEVEAIGCPFEQRVIDDFLAFWGFVAWAQKTSARWMLHSGFDRSKFEPWTNGIAGTFSAAPRRALAAIVRLRRFARDYANIMLAYDVLVCPTCAEPPPPLGYLATDEPFEIAFDRLRAHVPFTPIQNAAGAPAISLPLGRTAAGLPIGVQFAAAHGRDRLLLDLARSIEQAQPFAALHVAS